MGTRSRPLVLAIAVTALLGACETAPAAPSVRTAPMTGPVPGDVRAIGARLVGSRWDRSGASRPVASSDGRHWRAVPLPGAPAGLYPSLGLTSTAAGVAFTGRALGPVPGTSLAGPSGPPYGWTSLDGVTWQGGRLATAAPLLTAVSAAAVDRRTTLVVSQPDATGLTVTRFDRRSHPTTVPVTGLTLAGVPGGIAGETAVADAGWTDAGAWVLGLRFAGSNPRPDAGRAVSTTAGAPGGTRRAHRPVHRPARSGRAAPACPFAPTRSRPTAGAPGAGGSIRRHRRAIPSSSPACRATLPAGS